LHSLYYMGETGGIDSPFKPGNDIIGQFHTPNIRFRRFSLIQMNNRSSLPRHRMNVLQCVIGEGWRRKVAYVKESVE